MANRRAGEVQDMELDECVGWYITGQLDVTLRNLSNYTTVSPGTACWPCKLVKDDEKTHYCYNTYSRPG